MKQLPCKICGGRGPHEGPGHNYDPAEVPQEEVDALATMVYHTSVGTHLTTHDHLRSLLGRLQPNHQVLVRMRNAERKQAEQDKEGDDAHEP